MTFYRYQIEAMRTAKQMSLKGQITEAALGMSGEAGEVADLIKKHLSYGVPLSVEKLAAEMGDVLWYIARMCTALGITMDDVANGNIQKLAQRYPTGYSDEAAVARVDVTGEQHG